jgi:hypothetical protein
VRVIKHVQVGPRPAVGAVMGNKDRQIAHDRDAAIVRVLLHCTGLCIETPLHESPEVDFIRMQHARGGQCGGVARTQRRGPLPPWCAVMRGFQRHEQGVVVEPVGLLRGPLCKCSALVSILLRDEATVCTAQLRVTPADDTAEVDGVRIEAAFR